jgi:chorismate mutase
MSVVDDIKARLRRNEETQVLIDPRVVDLSARREELTQRVAELQYDLGGLTYEMAARDHFRLDVLTRRAAALQELDAELGEVERLLRMEESATSGTCRSCGAVHSRGAAYCWHCGAELLVPAAH